MSSEGAAVQKTPTGLQISYVIVPVDEKLAQLVGKGRAPGVVLSVCM